MSKPSETIDLLVAEFARMPGIGTRTAQRLAYYVQSLPPGDATRLADAILAVKSRLRVCSTCSNVSETDPCPICADASRDRTTVCVVERVRDLAALEALGSYKGLYHVLGGHIAPLDGLYPENLSIESLVRRIQKDRPREVILATNPDTEGDATANYLIERLAPLGVTISTLARGVPAGGQLEHAAKNTLAGALAGRRTVPSKEP